MDKSFLTLGDLQDFYYKLNLSDSLSQLNKLFLSRSEKIKKTWRKTDSLPTNWWSVPKVTQRRNLLITGDPEIHYTEYVYNKYLRGRKNLTALSPGCGTGSQEILFANFDCFKTIDAFDISKNRINDAGEKANSLYFDCLNFFVQDVNEFDFSRSKYDLVFFHGSLHHFYNIDELFKKVRSSLQEKGIIIIYEYVGPRRFQWTTEQLKLVNHLLNTIPFEFKRRWNSTGIKKKHYRPGLIRMMLNDPSEAVNSDKILPLLEKHFNNIEIKNIGGNLLHLLLKDISHNFLKNDKETNQLLDELFRKEDEFIKKYKSDYIFGVFN